MKSAGLYHAVVFGSDHNASRQLPDSSCTARQVRSSDQGYTRGGPDCGHCSMPTDVATNVRGRRGTHHTMTATTAATANVIASTER